MVVPRDDGLVAVLAANLDVLNPLGHDNLLLVRAFLDKDDLMVVGESTADLYGVADVTKLTCAVASHKERVRAVVGIGSANC